MEAGFDLGMTAAIVDNNKADNFHSSNKQNSKWRHGISKEAEKRIVKAKELQAVVLEETIQEQGSSVKFSIFTEQEYEVQVKKEPCCSCADFQIRESEQILFGMQAYVFCIHTSFGIG